MIAEGTLALLIKEIVGWLAGLRRASDQRKRECLEAVESVVAGVRRTEAYCRARDGGETSLKTEGQLAEMWTKIGFKLRGVGVTDLAKRCDVKGRYWANPKKFSEEWWDAADIGLAAVERLAHQIRARVEAAGKPN